MTTRCNPIIRAAALLILTLVLCSAPSALRAQTVCACDHYTLVSEAGVNCRLAICYRLSPSGPTICTLLLPGGTVQIPCPVYEATVRLCDGTNYVLIGPSPVISICTPNLSIAPGCCVRACRGRDSAGCPLLTFSAVPCATPTCP